MDLRSHPRIAADITPVQITGLGTLQLKTVGRILEVSVNGLRLFTSAPLPVDSFLRLEFDDAAILCQVRYSQQENQGYASGVFVEEILIGTSDLARLVASLIAEKQSGPLASRLANVLGSKPQA